MKVVILHDWLTCYRGGERILEAICEVFPEAPIYTLIHEKGSTSPYLESRVIRTSFMDKIPGIYRNYRYFLPLMPFAAESIKIPEDTDLVISSSHCVIKGVRKPKGAKHICYLYSPMRYIYDQFDNYFGSSSLPVKLVAKLARPFLVWWDKRSNKEIDFFLPISKFIQQRIFKFYGTGVPSRVLYPFVDHKDFDHIKSEVEKEPYYLMVTAFAPNKRVDLAIKAFNKLGKTLKIIGGGSEADTQKLKEMAGENIEILGRLNRDSVIKHYQKAQAFIFPGVEDFGITPLESLASGTPVIAYKSGGALETLSNQTAVFFEDPSPESLINAIIDFEKIQADMNFDDFKTAAESFSKKRFLEDFSMILKEHGIEI